MQQNMGLPQKIIVMEPSSNIRAMGRTALRGKWPQAILATIISLLMLQIPAIIVNQLFGKEQVFELAKVMKDAGLEKYVTDEIADMSYKVLYSPISQVYVLLVSGALAFGLTLFFVNLFRSGSQSTGDLVKGFGYYVRTTGLFLYMLLFMIFWSLIPIAGLILAPIAAIRYSQSFYVAIDHPEYPITLCVAESKVLMMGNKGKYFCLQLSFIGWILLAGLAGSIVTGVVTYMMAPGEEIPYLTTQILSLISSVIACPVAAYMMSTDVAFYEILTGKIQAETYIPGQY